MFIQSRFKMFTVGEETTNSGREFQGVTTLWEKNLLARAVLDRRTCSAIEFPRVP